MRRFFTLLGALLLLVITVPLALSQDLSESPSILRDIWEILKPLVVVLVSTVGSVLIPVVAFRLVGFLGIKNENEAKALEAKVRDALHQSAENALKYALFKLNVVPTMNQDLPKAVIETAIDYVKSKNPDTAAEAKVDEKDLTEIILSKAPNIISALAEAAKAKTAEPKPAR